MERRFQLVLAFETTFYRTNARPVVSRIFGREPTGDDP